MDVSVIIVSFNTRDLTLACLKSVFHFTKDLSFEVIMVDNNSYDGSADCVAQSFPNVKIIRLSKNVGFGCANNIGAREAKGKYLFLLNSDTELICNTIKSFFEFMELNSRYASCGCNLIDGNGNNAVCHGCLPTIQLDIFTLGLNRIFKKYYRNKLAEGQTVDYGNLENTGYITGADIFIRKDVFDCMKGFDSNIFLYYEETDLFCRMIEAGFNSCVLPKETIIHYGGGSGGNVTLQKTLMYEKSRLYYFRKHHCGLYVFLDKLFRLINLMLRRIPDKRKFFVAYLSL